MTKARYAAAALYLIVAAVSAVMGSIYLTSDTFMPYHAQALQMNWSEVEPALQTLLLALMRVAAAGWLAIAIVTAALVAVPYRHGARWARLTLPIMLLVFYIPTLWATVLVTMHTPAAAPWYGNLAAVVSVVIGVALDRPWSIPTAVSG